MANAGLEVQVIIDQDHIDAGAIALRILQKRFPMCEPGWTAADMLRQIETQIIVLQEVTRELTDGEECWYDHHGYCQAHNLHERVCPHARAKELLPEPSPQE